MHTLQCACRHFSARCFRCSLWPGGRNGDTAIFAGVLRHCDLEMCAAIFLVHEFGIWQTPPPWNAPDLTAGLRFISSKGEKIDLVYGNIRHGIFQPCEKEHVVLVHFHLRNAIMVGKKKFKDIQFFTEVIEASQALDGRHKSDYDQDELHAEERERKLREELNKAFKKFVVRTEEVADSDAGNNGFKSFEVAKPALSFT
jgi:hypothetical protein